MSNKLEAALHGAPACAHCGRPVAGDERRGYVHLAGQQTQLQRCDPQDTGLPYGYNAHPEGTECQYPCLGGKR